MILFVRKQSYLLLVGVEDLDVLVSTFEVLLFVVVCPDGSGLFVDLKRIHR